MRDLLKVVQILPISACITTIIYLFYYTRNKEKLKEVSKLDKCFRYIFIGWWVMFIYITQLMPFGNGFGERINLRPLQPLIIAIKYGLENAPMVNQLLLNTLMFVPLGFLLPIVFKNKFKTFTSVLIVSFITTVLTEFIQLFTLRGTDIDDVISNTLGGVIGFALYVFCVGIYNFKKKNRKITLNNYRLKCIMSILLIIVTLAPFQLIKVIDSNREFGQVYYGHQIPESVELISEIPSQETKGIVYKNVKLETKEEVATRLNEIMGLDIKFLEDDYGIYEGDVEDMSIFIYEDNTWYISYLEENTDIDVSRIPNEEEGKIIAEEYLEKFRIQLDHIEYKGIDNEYRDEYLHLVYTPKNLEKDIFIK